MTKRRSSNRKPTGVNRSLGNSLLNDRERARLKHRANKGGDPDHENAAFLDYAKVDFLAISILEKNIDHLFNEYEIIFPKVY